MLVANLRDEVKDFLARYSDAELFVYLLDRCVPECTPPPPVVEYHFEEAARLPPSGSHLMKDRMFSCM